MAYWLDLFTGTTWKEFRTAGARVTGFRAGMQSIARGLRPGDILLSYVTGIQRWVGALEVVGPSTDDEAIWGDEPFPVRFEVRPMVMLDPEHGVPMDQLAGKVEFFQSDRQKGKFKGFLRRSPNRFLRDRDGALVLSLLHGAKSTPVSRPVDPKKLAQKPLYKAKIRRGKATVSAVVSIPDGDDGRDGARRPGNADESEHHRTQHTEVQHRLLALGADMGLDVWVARNDRKRRWKGRFLESMPGVLTKLPLLYAEATNKTIELIDVLWLNGKAIVAAFEIECTTDVHGGLLRMSDLIALQPNIDINLYLVAPGERIAKVRQEILRPTFSILEKPLPRVCGFISISRLTEKIEAIRQLKLTGSVRATFLRETAEYFEPE